MIKRFFLIIFIIFFFSSCSISENKKIKITTTTWIGYTPLFYAKEKNWLELLNIKLLNVVSLSENMHLYKAGNADAFVGTQYEYNFLYKEDKSLIPIMIFDKSNGGDVILSNLSLKELSKTNKDKDIDAYLEIDSINSILLNDFIESNNLQNKKINYINENQLNISRLKARDMVNPTIIATYVPYNNILEKSSFIELSSTKRNDDLLIVDGMYVKEDFYSKNKETFIKLKSLIDKAIINLQNNPEEFYNTVKPYLTNTSYEDFLASLNDILWFNKDIPQNVLQKLDDSNFNTKDLIK
jgi:NitT/TauT family transport system substrate-binding protein